jgi:membrane AbrB-like protein
MPTFITRLSRWGALTLASAVLAVALHMVGLPGAIMLGPMLCGVLFALRGVPVAVHRRAFILSQSMFGCLVAQTLTPSLVEPFARHWPVMALVIATIVLSGTLAGFVLMRFGSLPGSTAAWGTTPGGAAIMTAMAEAHGADLRMVAFMQYMRLFVVVLTASVVSYALLDHRAVPPDPVGWSLGFDAPLVPLLQTLLIVVGGCLLGHRLPLPSGALLIPMLAGAALNSSGVVQLTLPFWLQCCTYAVLGWYVGLGFTAATVRYALRSLPQMLATILLLMSLCSAAAWMLTRFMGVDGLTAYLATSPGGLDTVTAIALGSDCDVPFVIALQTLRLFAVVLAGPPLARLLCRIGPPPAGSDASGP